MNADVDNNIPSIGLGTFRLKGEDAYNAVRTALKLGYRHIDTAQIYGNEQDVGRAIHPAYVEGQRDDRPTPETSSPWFVWHQAPEKKVGRKNVETSPHRSREKINADFNQAR